MSDYLNTKRAAEYLGLSPRTLEKWRCTGRGPTWRRSVSQFGHLTTLYKRDELDAWKAGKPSAPTSPVRTASVGTAGNEVPDQPSNPAPLGALPSRK